MDTVRALVCSAPGQLSLTDVAAPEHHVGHALVKPLRVGICGTDYHIFEGKHPFLQYPRIMGHELAVEILSVPEGGDLKPGDLCTINPYLTCGTCRTCQAGKSNCCENISVLGVHQDGGMAQLLSVPAGNLVKAPGLSADACATVEFLAIGAHAVRRAAPSPGETALVVGAGPIGLGAALFARLSGADVFVSDIDPTRATQVAQLAGVQTATGTSAEAYDCVFDATGNSRAMEASFDYVAAGGRYVMVGVVKDRIAFSDPDFHRREMTLMGSRNATQEDFERVIAAVHAGEVDVDGIITHRTTLANAAADLAKWASSKDGLIKAVIEIG